MADSLIRLSRKAALGRNAALAAAALGLAGSVAAQPAGPDTAPPAPCMTSTVAAAPSYFGTDSQALSSALAAARRGDVASARAAMGAMSNPTARKIATWALVDASAELLSFQEIDQARRDLADWPRATRRQTAAEKRIETGGLGPQQIVAWFGKDEPRTPEGAMALAQAYRALGRNDDATQLIRRFWRDKMFEAPAQRTMLARFGDMLRPEDHIRRTDVLLYGAQGPATQDMLALLPYEERGWAEARIALRRNASDANAKAQAVVPRLADEPGLVFERAAYARKRGLDTVAAGLLSKFPRSLPHDEAADRVWNERYQLTLAALRNGDARGAYAAAADTGVTTGADAAEAEFYAGWVALTRLKDPARADRHFAAIERIGVSPITRARALYWRGRAAEARGDQAQATNWYGQAARYNTTFYGQLAGERVGDARLHLGRDPQISAQARAAFEARDTVQAARLLYQSGERDLFRVFVLALDDILPTLEDQAQLVDLARGYGDQDTSMKVVRAAAQRGFILPDRGYPVRTPPQLYSGPESALVLGITRQESGFDPLVRSGVGARGMMQLMPATAQLTASKMGVGYQASMLDDPEYNMRLGSAYLGEMLGRFSGSYVMAVAAYNAGPGRPAQWSSFCGDPRTSSIDPIDFVECIPFSETRNYVMRVLEGMQVYRAKANGGSAPITLAADLSRGSYGYPQAVERAAASPGPTD